MNSRSHRFPRAILGQPRVHLRETDSTNERARALADAGAPHGTLVTASFQRAGRGRQGRSWSAPAGRALLMSVIVHEVDPLLPLRTGLAVADLAVDHGHAPAVKWPNDVLIDGRKLAGVLVEARPSAGWAVIGIGVNVALRPSDLPEELRDRAASLGAEPGQLEAGVAALLAHLETRLAEPGTATLAALRERDALLGELVRWSSGEGVGAGIDEHGALRVRIADGRLQTLEAGEVHLARG